MVQKYPKISDPSSRNLALPLPFHPISTSTFIHSFIRVQIHPIPWFQFLLFIDWIDHDQSFIYALPHSDMPWNISTHFFLKISQSLCSLLPSIVRTHTLIYTVVQNGPFFKRLKIRQKIHLKNNCFYMFK